MGHWVTLDDGQKVFIGSGGRVLATRGAISSAAGGKERGKALAERSRAAVARGLTKARKAKTSRQSGLVPKSEQTTKEERLAAIVERSKAREYGQSKDVFFKTPFQGRKFLPSKEEVKAEVTRQNRVAGTEKAKATRIAKSKGESPATTRAIEHARAAAAERPSLREQAEKAREERGISQGGRTALARALNRARSNIQHPPPIEAKSDKQQAYAQDVRAKQIEGIHKPRQLSNIEFARKTIAESTLRRGKLARESKASDIINVRDASSRAGAQAKKLVERFYEPAKYRSTQTFRSRLRSR